MFKKKQAKPVFPAIKVTKRDVSRFSPEFNYTFEVEHDGVLHRTSQRRYPEIYIDEEKWLRDKKDSFKEYILAKKKERPVGVFYI